MSDDARSIMPGGAFHANAVDAVEHAWRNFAFSIELIAGNMTDDEDMRDDLVQEAMIRLWKTDPTRFDLRDRVDVRYLHKILVHRMWDVWDGDGERQLAAMQIGTAAPWMKSLWRPTEEGRSDGGPGDEQTGGDDRVRDGSRGSEGAGSGDGAAGGDRHAGEDGVG